MTKSDLIVSLWDGRVMPMAFETSDSEARSADLVRETMNYVWTWNRPLGSGRTIPATSLYGIFEVHSLWSTQNNGLTIF